jgi:hypothetical protein
MRPFRLLALAAATVLILTMIAAWLLNVPLPWVVFGGALVALVVLRLYGRATRSRPREPR